MKAGTFTLTAEALQMAILERLDRNKDRLGDRENNIGASRVGYCARATVLDEGSEAPPEPKTAGKWLSGRVLENEIVQLVRLALGNRVRGTGRNQEELAHATAPLICHPDGTILGPFEHEGEEFEGDGALEVKSASSGAFRKYGTKGLPLWYVDQATSQMGLKGLKWCLFVVVNAEALNEWHWWVIPFDAARYQWLVERSSWLQDARKQAVIPAGETDRGWCDYCQHRKTCAEYVGLVARNEAFIESSIPTVTRLELEALGEELGAINLQLKPLKKREEAIKEEARALAESTGLDKAELRSVVFELRGGGEVLELDKKALEKGEPELVARYLKPALKKPSFYFTPKKATA